MNGTRRWERWPGEPDTCECTRMTVATIEETLGCPAGWRWIPGTGWLHMTPARRP